jgi:hypothetical protein
MSDSPGPSPPAGHDPGPDFLKTIEEYKRARVQFGCLGLGGWRLLLALCALALVVYLIRHPLTP